MGNDLLQTAAGAPVHKTTLRFLHIPTERFNGLSLIFSFVALIVSVIAVFSNGLPNIFKPQAVTVYTEHKIGLSQSFGRFATSMSVSVINEGGTDINLRDADLSVTFEDGRQLVMHGDSWRYPGTYATPTDLTLRDIVIKRGSNWTGIVLFEEVLPRDQMEKIADFRDLVTADLSSNSRRAQEEVANRFAEGMALILDDSKKATSDERKAALMTWGKAMTPSCFHASPVLQKQYTDMSTAGASKFIKGRHQLRFVLRGASGTLYSSARTFIAFERDVRAVGNLGNLDLSYCGAGSSFQFKPGTATVVLEEPSSS